MSICHFWIVGEGNLIPTLHSSMPVTFLLIFWIRWPVESRVCITGIAITKTAKWKKNHQYEQKKQMNEERYSKADELTFDNFLWNIFQWIGLLLYKDLIKRKHNASDSLSIWSFQGNEGIKTIYPSSVAPGHFDPIVSHVYTCQARWQGEG